jgi:hypothetical protein
MVLISVAAISSLLFAQRRANFATAQQVLARD